MHIWGMGPSLCEETGKRRFSLQEMGLEAEPGCFRVPGAVPAWLGSPCTLCSAGVKNAEGRKELKNFTLSLK